MRKAIVGELHAHISWALLQIPNRNFLGIDYTKFYAKVKRWGPWAQDHKKPHCAEALASHARLP